MNSIPEDAQRLASRLRAAADEIESAARYGVPIPPVVSVSSFTHGGLSFSADEREFAAWVDYTETEAEHYDHHGTRWSSVRVDVNGLELGFAVRHEAAEVAS